ncbi:hypothetical protein DP83_06950 [Vibrio metoecus]|uniref:Uncharacterized protein n=1 Tax=Vibrio metoecus TaxID=1481663 RepID=A0ABR4RZ26_VIBMT|nr:hypothetical protein DP83_06950 [Vibrio metoecus]
MACIAAHHQLDRLSRGDTGEASFSTPPHLVLIQSLSAINRREFALIVLSVLVVPIAGKPDEGSAHFLHEDSRQKHVPVDRRKNQRLNR